MQQVLRSGPRKKKKKKVKTPIPENGGIEEPPLIEIGPGSGLVVESADEASRQQSRSQSRNHTWASREQPETHNGWSSIQEQANSPHGMTSEKSEYSLRSSPSRRRPKTPQREVKPMPSITVYSDTNSVNTGFNNSVINENLPDEFLESMEESLRSTRVHSKEKTFKQSRHDRLKKVAKMRNHGTPTIDKNRHSETEEGETSSKKSGVRSERYSTSDNLKLPPEFQESWKPSLQEENKRSFSPLKVPSPSPEQLLSLSTESMRQASPEKRRKSSPGKKRRSSPEKRRPSSPERRMLSASDKILQGSSAEMVVRPSSPERRRPSSPEQRRQTSPSRRIPSSPGRGRSLSPDKTPLPPVDKTWSSFPDRMQPPSPDKLRPPSPDKMRQPTPEEMLPSTDEMQPPFPENMRPPSPDRRRSSSPVKGRSTSPTKFYPATGKPEESLSPTNKNALTQVNRVLAEFDRILTPPPGMESASPHISPSISPLPDKQQPLSSYEQTGPLEEQLSAPSDWHPSNDHLSNSEHTPSRHNEVKVESVVEREPAPLLKKKELDEITRQERRREIEKLVPSSHSKGTRSVRTTKSSRTNRSTRSARTASSKKRTHISNSIFNGHLMKWRFEAEEGSPFVRIPLFFSAASLLFTTSFALVLYSNAWTIASIVMAVFIYAIALIGCILEGRFMCNNPVGLRAHLRSTLTRDVFFLRLLWGRSVIYMIGGLLSVLLLTPPTIVTGAIMILISSLSLCTGNYASRRFYALRYSLRDKAFLMNQFDKHDYDKDGYITLSGFVALLSSLGMELDDRYIIKAFHSVDSDGDCKISFEDFNYWWKEGYHKPRPKATGVGPVYSLRSSEMETDFDSDMEGDYNDGNAEDVEQGATYHRMNE